MGEAGELPPASSSVPVRGDALALPFSDGSFDAATVGFGDQTFEEMMIGFYVERFPKGQAPEKPAGIKL